MEPKSENPAANSLFRVCFTDAFRTSDNPKAAALACADRTAEFIAQFDVPKTLREAGVPREELGEIVAPIARELAHMGGVDRPMTEKEVCHFYELPDHGRPSRRYLARDTRARHAIGFEFRFIDFIQGSQQSLQYYLRELQSRPYVYGTDYLPWDGGTPSLQTGRSIRDQLIAAGPRVKVMPKLSVEQGIQAARTIFGKCFFDAEKCYDGIQAMRHYRYEVDEAKSDSFLVGMAVLSPNRGIAEHPAEFNEALTDIIGVYPCHLEVRFLSYTSAELTLT